MRDFLKCSGSKSEVLRLFFVEMGLEFANAGTISIHLFGWSSVGNREIKGERLT